MKGGVSALGVFSTLLDGMNPADVPFLANNEKLHTSEPSESV